MSTRKSAFIYELILKGDWTVKLTLFTISNEQIKEQLSKLQTKVESLETVKEVQDKIIATKDSQIAFLNGQIANIWTPIAIVAGIITLVVTYVAWVNKRADKKIEQGESLISQNRETATTAKKELDKLTEKQTELNELAAILKTNQQIDMSFRVIKQQLDLVEYSLDKILTSIQEPSFSITEEEHKKLGDFLTQRYSLASEYVEQSIKFNVNIINSIDITSEDKSKLDNLQTRCQDFYTNFNIFEKSLEENNPNFI